MKRRWAWALAVMAVVMALALPADAKSSIPRDEVSQRLTRKGAAGRIDVRAGKKQFPADAEVSLTRTHAQNAQRKIKDGLMKRRGSDKSVASPKGSRGSGTHAASPAILAMYDISIRHGSKKWQPDAGDPVRVTVDLEEPVAVTAASSLGVVHLADDDTVEELPASRYGFTYNADKTAVNSFWVDADGFSVYAIVDETGDLVTPRRFYHFYDHPSAIEGSNAVQTFPYRYTDRSNDVVNVQIVKSGDWLKEPPIPEDVIDEHGSVVSMFEGWYVVHSEPRPSSAVESKLDSTNSPFVFVWPVGVTDNRLAFTNGVDVTESVDMDYYVVPLYEHARFLQFNESEREEHNAGERIIDRKIIALNDETGVAHVKVSDVSAALKNSRQEYFCGWSYLDKNGQYSDLLIYSHAGMHQDAYIEIDNDLFEANGGKVIHLWPVYVSAHFLNFDTNAKGSGATYVGSIFVRSTTDISSVTPSGNRPGYDFDGWCAGTVENGKVTLGERISDANGTFIANVTVTNKTGEVVFQTDASGNIRLNKDVTLYASWRANTSASYRVIVWQQRVTDAKDAAEANKTYYYVTHYTSPVVPATTQISESMITSFTGTRADNTSISSVNLTTLSGKAEANVANEDFTGFHYARYSCTDATVAPDGSSAINVYYDRDLITLRFCLYDSNQSETIYTTTTSTSGDIYGTDDGENYFTVYYDNGQWYRTRTSVPGYSYSTQHTGTRYVKNGNNYSTTTSNSGTQYRKSGSRYYEIFYNESDGKWYQNRTETTTYAYSDPYSGYRYTVSTSHWIVNQTMTGLYGQTLARNGYTWPAERAWKDEYSGSSSSGTSISFLDAFLPTPVGDETFYSSANSSSSGAIINFYKEALDGSWTLANEYHSGSSSVNFNISDKYNGFEAYQYSKNGGAWTGVGTYNETSGYYGSQVSSVTSTLDIRFKRKEFELIYKDGNETVYDTGKKVPYESSLAGYNLGVNDSRLDWKGRDTSVGTFEGWYEDASLTVPFDFSGTMPDGKKFLYAKWAPVKYRVIIDPNGGEMQSGDSTWFYLDAGEKVVEYTVTRKYRLNMHNGTYYYHHDLWDPVKDKHTDQYDPSTAGAPRLAYYTENIEEATSNEVSDPENRYSYESGAYSFMGWYEVLEDGTVSLDPFNFSEPPNRPVTIRAVWRRTSVYALKYESIDPDGERPTEELRDPELGVEGGYIDDGVTTLAKDPTNYDHEKWIWEGWQVVDVRNNYNPLTNIRSPGDMYIVHAEHADDRDNVIHFRAVYSLREGGNSRHIPEVVDFVLDANEGAGLAANAAIQGQDGRLGTYSDGEESALGGLNAGVWFAGQQNNFSVNLADYSSKFVHANGYFLLGWDTNRVNTTMIPAYYANETIGVDKSDADENVLYAVWEPQVYIEFVNDTGTNLTDITLYIPSWTSEGLFRVNEVTGTYQRETFSNFAEGSATFDLAVGERLRLVLPDGADRDFAVFGDCSYSEGTKLVITRTEPQIVGEATIPDEVFNAYAGEHYQVTGTMKTSPTPVQVRFTKSTYPTTATVPVRYFLHDKNGTVTEITQYSAAYWSSQSFQTSLTVGTAVSDIATMLRTDNSSLGVHELLSDNVRTTYGHTTIGIGSASAVITTDHETLHANEYRSITQEGASGGPYFRFYHEELEWSRYSQVWNGYDDPAVYVVFYKRTPVHVTIGKNVVGSEEDKSRTFDFTAQITQHSTNLEYTVTTTYRQTREISIQAYSTPSSSDWDTAAAKVAWSDPTGTQTNTSNATASSDQTPDLFESRSPEQISLADSARHPITIYYDQSDDMIGTPVLTESTQYGSVSSSGLIRKTYTRTQTKTTTQTVTYRVTYQYEVATIQEAENDAFTLTSIDGGGNSCKGTVNLPARTYTISSLSAPDAKGFFTYQSLDTAIFTNTRKTGSLTVSKTVVDGDAGDTFNFIVTLGETVVGKDSYVTPAGVHLGPYGKVFTFSLANGDNQTLTGLPAGATYTVEEVVNDKYVATVPANAAGTVVADATTTVGFTNTRKTDLSIAMKDRTVYFNGDEQHGCDISSVTGTGDTLDTEDYTVTGLKSGHVLIVEHHVAAHGTAVGSYAGHFENARVTVHDFQDNDVTQAYIISTTPGSLTIEPTPIIVTVTGNHATKTYNGQEQSCEGYTYAIEHATTHEPVESGNIFVSIPPDYQQAFRKDVGRSDMYIQPGRVNVTVPEGVSVSNIVVTANGYIEITPAPVTVTANDAEKIAGRNDPALTATVTGLIEGEPEISYSVSRAAGEEVGTYVITASGTALQGNYAVTFVNGTFTIKGLPDLVQRATGTGLEIQVPVTDGLLAAAGIDPAGDITTDAVGDILNAFDPNGLRRWENLVTGTATNQPLLSTKFGDVTDGMALPVGMTAGQENPVDMGYNVLYELRRQTTDGWTRVAGPAESSDSSEFSIELEDGDGKSKEPTGLYRMVTLIVPKHELSITNEIPSTNIIGVLEVDSAITNTVVAVPWKQLASDPKHAGNITVANYVSSLNLTPGDHVYAFEEIPSKGASASGGATYMMWTLQSDGTWTSATTIKSTEAGYSVMSVAEDAETKEFARTQAVWLQRQRPLDKDGKPVPFFLIGQYDSDGVEITVKGGTSSEPGYTLLSVPDYRDYSINDLDWSGYASAADSTDFIRVVDGSQSFLLKWSDGKWCTEEVNYRRGRPAGMKYVPYETPFKAGTGFWFCRHGGEFTIKWAPSEEVQ